MQESSVEPVPPPRTKKLARLSAKKKEDRKSVSWVPTYKPVTCYLFFVGRGYNQNKTICYT